MAENLKLLSAEVKCDQPGCDWKETVSDDITMWHNTPCPKCGKGVIIDDEALAMWHVIKQMETFFNNFPRMEGPSVTTTISPEDFKTRH